MIEDLRRFHGFVSQHPVGARDQMGAWTRWLRWQLGSRLLGAPVVMPWLDDSCLIVERGMTGATGNLYCGLHEFADMALVLHYFGGGQGMFVDVGANIGSYTILAAKVCGAATLAVEPVPSTFQRLERNIAANRISDRVEARCCAAGLSSGEIRFSTDRDTTNQVVDESYTGSSIAVPVTSLDELLAGRSSGLWKIDVEGFEREVLDGALRALNDDALEIVLLEGDDESIRETMATAGFSTRRYDPFARRFSLPTAGDSGGNHVWVRESEDLCQRLRDAPKRAIHGVEF